MPFDGTVVIVTGAAGAIGSAAAARLTSLGATVLWVDRDAAGLERLGVATHVADVTRAEDVAAYVRAAQALGPIGGCFNNAAVEGPVRPLTDYDDADFDAVIAVNLRGVYLGLKHVLPALQEGGAVVNASSALGLVGAPGLCAYVSSKHAVIGLTK